jgi:hypothetical protein
MEQRETNAAVKYVFCSGCREIYRLYITPNFMHIEFFIGAPERKRPGRRWEDGIKMDFKHIQFELVY